MIVCSYFVLFFKASMVTCEYILYGAYSQFSFLYHLSPDIHLLCMCCKVIHPSPGVGGGGVGGG